MFPHTAARRLVAVAAPAISLLLLAFCPPAAAGAAIAHTVRWTASPLKSPTGQPLPPAIQYEVWLAEDGKPEALAATVPDTFWTLQAQPGVTYVARVRGVSAAGQKSAFSAYSDPWRAVAAAAPGSEAAALLGPIRPNPFNARTTIACFVPSEPPGGGVPRLDIFDLAGRRLRGLAVADAPGPQDVEWDGADDRGRPVPAGVYLVRLSCGRWRATARVTLLP